MGNANLVNCQVQEKTEWKHDEDGLYGDANCAFRFPNLEQAAAPAIRSVPVQKKHRDERDTETHSRGFAQGILNCLPIYSEESRK